MATLADRPPPAKRETGDFPKATLGATALSEEELRDAASAPGTMLFAVPAARAPCAVAVAGAPKENDPAAGRVLESDPKLKAAGAGEAGVPKEARMGGWLAFLLGAAAGIGGWLAFLLGAAAEIGGWLVLTLVVIASLLNCFGVSSL